MSFMDIDVLQFLAGAGGGIAGMYFIAQALKNAQDKSAAAVESVSRNNSEAIRLMSQNHSEIVMKLLNGVNNRLDVQGEALLNLRKGIDETNNKIDTHVSFCKSRIEALNSVT